MRRRQKIAVALTVDILLCLISVWAAMFLRTETFQLTPWQLLAPSVASVVIFIPLMSVMGVYNEIARFAGASTIYLIFKVFDLFANLCSFLVFDDRQCSKVDRIATTAHLGGFGIKCPIVH